MNLRGNARTSGEQRRKERDNVFGIGSRTTVAIALLVKNPSCTKDGAIKYQDIGDYKSRAEKLNALEAWGSLNNTPWNYIDPDPHGDWINVRTSTFGTFQPIGEKHDQDRAHKAIFAAYSRGLETGRDVWVYNSSAREVDANVNRTIDRFNELESAYATHCTENGIRDKSAVERFIDNDKTRLSWTLSLKNRLAARKPLTRSGELRTAIYRPFNKQVVYYDRGLNHILGQTPRMFPAGAQNHGFYVTAASSGHPFSLLAVSCLPDLAMWGSGSGQFFPRYTYEIPSEQPSLLDNPELTQVDNVSQDTLKHYQSLYGSEVTTDDVFFFVYGLLHSTDYRAEFAADLKKMLPRIPELASCSDFWAFAEAGKDLSNLHLDYESVPLYPLEVVGEVPEHLIVTKMRFGGKHGAPDTSQIRITDSLTVTGIPDKAYDYMLGSKSAIEWVMERYQVKTDKASGIVNDPNDWGREHGNPRYILELLLRIVTVSVETGKIVESLPPLRYVNAEAALVPAETF